MKYFLNSILKNILKSFKGYNFFWHIFAILLTYILVVTNIDWYYFIYTRSNTLIDISLPAIVLGGILPIIVPISFIIVGYILKIKKMEILGWALGQAAVMGSIISSFYKSFTGRIQPNLLDVTNNISGGFNFGFLRHGIFWGWPSSHTTVAFATAVALLGLFPKNKIIKYTSLFYAIYIGIGVSLSIHWFSDVLAGAIIGTIIGLIVARSYRNELE